MTVVFVHRLIPFENTCAVYMHVAVIAYAPDCDIRADAIESYPDSSSLLMANAEEILENQTLAFSFRNNGWVFCMSM
jgi:hypothetical protein